MAETRGLQAPLENLEPLNFPTEPLNFCQKALQKQSKPWTPHSKALDRTLLFSIREMLGAVSAASAPLSYLLIRACARKLGARGASGAPCFFYL